MTEIRFTRHALERMLERGISPEVCTEVFLRGETIESYPDDKPFPSELRMGRACGKVIHLVVSFQSDVAHVVTVYEPDPKLWNETFTVRKKRR